MLRRLRRPKGAECHDGICQFKCDHDKDCTDGTCCCKSGHCSKHCCPDHPDEPDKPEEKPDTPVDTLNRCRWMIRRARDGSGGGLGAAAAYLAGKTLKGEAPEPEAADD